MKKGTTYVAAVAVALAGYFVYQTWFNPSRAVKRRLGEIAGALSMPESEGEIDRVARLARLRSYLAIDVRLLALGVNIDGNGTVVGVLAALKAPKGGVDVQAVDVQVSIDSTSTARAGLMLEVNTLDPVTGEWRAEMHETIASLEKRTGEWIVVRAEIRPARR